MPNEEHAVLMADCVRDAAAPLDSAHRELQARLGASRKCRNDAKPGQSPVLQPDERAHTAREHLRVIEAHYIAAAPVLQVALSGNIIFAYFAGTRTRGMYLMCRREATHHAFCQMVRPCRALTCWLD